MASTLQLEFSQAMSDFKKMFPDIDREVIEAVLRANQGQVDSTIDQLLAMSIDNQNEKLRNELDGTAAPQSLINLNDSDKDLKRSNGTQVAGAAGEQLIDTTDGVGGINYRDSSTIGASAAANTALMQLGSTLTANNSNTASPNHTGASPKRPLSVKQLNATSSNSSTPTKRNLLAGTNATAGTTTTRRWNPPILGVLPPGFLRITPTASQQEYDLPDEQFALMLQNEEFMNQLRWNQDFMNALEKEQSGKAKGEDDAAFKERLKNMGKMSRKKFLQMARVFTWQRNKKVTTAKQIDSLPLKEEPSDDEDHQHQQQQQTQQQQAQQQQQQHGGQQTSQQQGQLQLRK